MSEETTTPPEAGNPPDVTNFEVDDSVTGFFHMDPGALHVQGIDDTPDDFDLSAFEDVRVTYPLSETLVASVTEQGVRKPIEVEVVRVGDTELFVVQDGRQRVRAAREAGVAEVPVIGASGTDANSIALWTVEANENRVHDSILVKCAKAAALNARGIKQKRIAVAYGESQSTISNWIKLSRASDYLKSLVENDTIAWTTAVKMAKWDDEKIKEAVERASEKDADNKAPRAKKATSGTIFGNFKETFLSVLEDFELPEAYADPTEAFVLGATIGAERRLDNAPDDLTTILNKKMSRRAKALKKRKEKASSKKDEGEKEKSDS